MSEQRKRRAEDGGGTTKDAPRIGYLGCGSYLPPTVVTNDELAEVVDTSDDWIQRRTGIRTRRVLGPNETILDMAVEASRRALDDAGVAAKDLDDIRVGVNTWLRFPSLATQVQDALGARRASASDVSAGCTGFVYGVEEAHQRLYTERMLYGRSGLALVVGVDGLSHITDWTDRSTCVLLGDGAGAVVLGEVDAGGILATHTGADGRYGDLLYSDPPLAPQVDVAAEGSDSTPPDRAPAGAKHFAHEERSPRPYLHMDGPRVYGIAVRTMVREVKAVLARHNRVAEQNGGETIGLEDVAYLYPHQANLRIIEMVAKKLGVPLERVYTDGVVEYGNTSTASIPIGYADNRDRGRGAKGDRYEIDVAFGAGFASGAILRHVVDPRPV